MCNQAAGLSRCLSKVQQDLSSQLKIIQTEHSKGKSADKVGSATDELQYLLHFNSSISQCMAKSMEHLSDFAFVSMYNFTLVRRDSYLAQVKPGIKQDTGCPTSSPYASGYVVSGHCFKESRRRYLKV